MSPTMMMSLSMNMMSIMIMLSSNSWLIMWMSFELNMLTFIPLMINNKNTSTSESMMKYFLIQALGSILFLMAMINKKMIMNENMSSMLVCLAMMIKLGCFPAHQWLPGVSEGISWNPLMMLLSTQKIMPLSILASFHSQMIIIVSAMITSMMGALGGFNQTSTKKILAFSSITHMGWLMMISKSTNTTSWYMIIYIMMMFMLLMVMKEETTNNITMNMSKTNPTLIIMMLSMAGLPPFLGFMPKWLAINEMMYNNIFTLSILILSTLINLSFYMKIFLKSSMMNSSMTLMKFMKTSSMLSMLLTITLPMMMMMFFLKLKKL